MVFPQRSWQSLCHVIALLPTQNLQVLHSDWHREKHLPVSSLGEECADHCPSYDIPEEP